jgi:hypothetical protein
MIGEQALRRAATLISMTAEAAREVSGRRCWSERSPKSSPGHPHRGMARARRPAQGHCQVEQSDQGSRARRNQRRTVDGERPSAAAIRRCPRPLALRARAVPITSVESARRGCSAAGSRTWVAPQPRQRTRRGRTSIVSAPRPRTRRRRPYPHRFRVSPHPRRGQRIRPSARASSADSAAQTMIIKRYGGHEAPAWSITSSPGRGQIVLVADGSESALRQLISSVGHRHREDRPDTW